MSASNGEANNSEVADRSDGQHGESETGGGLAPVLRPLLRVSYFLSAFALITVTALVLAQIFFRYVMGTPLTWAEEIARLTLVLITFWGLAWVDSRDSHLAIEFDLPDAVPNVIVQALYIVRSVLTGLVALTLAYAAFVHGTGLQLSAPATGLPLSFHFYLVAIGLLAWAMYRFVVTSVTVIEMRKEEQAS